MIARYLVFAADHFYPACGWEDFVLSTDSLDEARATLKDYVNIHEDDPRAGVWFRDFDTSRLGHIVDTNVPCIIIEAEKHYGGQYKEWPVSEEDGVRPCS